MKKERPLERCDGCGLRAPGGAAGCQALFEELLARDFGDARFFRVHRLLVDTYSLQHPDRYCASAKSMAAHLTGLCWLMERGGSAAVGHAPLRAWLDGTPALDRPDPPEFRGGATIADLCAATDAVEHARAVEAWARSTWEAYAPLHVQAREWIEQALSRPSEARPRRPRR